MFLAQFHCTSPFPSSRNELITVSNAFPTRSGLVLGAVTGAFDASSLPLVFFKLAYFSHGGKPSM